MAALAIPKDISEFELRPWCFNLPAEFKLCDDPNMGKFAVYVWGPYRDGPAKYRLKIAQNGEEKSVCFHTQAEAAAVKERLLYEANAQHQRTISDLLDEYHSDSITLRAVKVQTADDVRAQLARFLPLEKPIRSLSPDNAERLYRDFAQRPNERTGKPLSASTHQHTLVLSKMFFKWAVKRGQVAHNPFTDVSPIGRRSAGKLQLRIDEARRFEAAALAMAQGGDAGALGVLIMLHMGLRQGEVKARLARDVDDDGRVLWISAGKTENAKRRLKVPAVLRPLLLSLSREKPADGLLFYEGARPPGRNYFWKKVHAVCKRADVPIVCPHSLRGLHATLALEAGATADLVARALGHGSFEVTARHYASGESVANARTARVAEALGTAAAPPPSESSITQAIGTLAAALKSLPPELRAHVLSQLKAD